MVLEIVIASMLIVSTFWLWRISYYLLLLLNQMRDMTYYISEISDNM